MQVTVGFSNQPDSTAAGKETAQAALAKADRKKPCDMVTLFATAGVFVIVNFLYFK